ncbi:MAG: helix-turn-helix transcriptional regulator [Rhodothermia bacterium]|nr:helix-turn-helix transcriptional regulator [Rhodothermia bacterium]
MTYVHNHLFDPELNCTQALKTCGLGDHNITSHFRLIMGCSLKTYIEQHRLTVAKEVMTHTNLPLYLIADAVGYSNVSTFSDAFSRIFGSKPSAYRHNLHKTR